MSFSKLPKNVREIIVSLLPPGDVITLLQVNKELKNYKNDEDLWMTLFQRDFEQEKPTGYRTWKNAYESEWEALLNELGDVYEDEEYSSDFDVLGESEEEDYDEDLYF